MVLSYLVRGARWTPSYDLQFDPGRDVVRVALSGEVAQRTGEEWPDVSLTLSTALPARARGVPVLAAWRIGEAELFVPRTVAESPAPRALEPIGAAQPGDATAGIHGVILDATNQAPVRDAVVIASLAGAVGEVTAATGDGGAFELDGLRTGVWSITIQREGYQPFTQQGLSLRRDRTIHVKLQVVPDSFKGEQVEIVAMKPTLSVTSTTVGGTIGREQLELMPGGPIPGSNSGNALNRFFNERATPAQPDLGLSIAVPKAAEEPLPAPGSAAALAGGFDLAFAAARRETIPSGAPPRAVPLLAESWPATARRDLFAGISGEAWLVAAVRNPSTRTLPGGPARLAIGGDPAGSAQLALAVPGEPITLPLGRDRAVRAARTVRTSSDEKGLFSKDEVTEYAVAVEVVSPHPRTTRVRLVDQWPLAAGEDIKSELLRVEPAASRRDDATGSLEWALQLAPAEKRTVRFTYALRRPRGFRLEEKAGAP